MTSSATIRAAIVTRLSTVEGIGRVHAFERYAKHAAAMIEHYRFADAPDGTSNLRGWHVRRAAMRRSAISRMSDTVSIDWRIRGFISLIDERESELLADALVDAACAVFADDLTLGGVVNDAAGGAGFPVGLQLLSSAPYMLGGVLCHGVELGLTTEHVEQRSTAEAALADLKIAHANWELPPRDKTGPALPDDDDAAATDHLKDLDK